MLNNNDSYAWSFGIEPDLKINKSEGCYIWLNEEDEPYIDITSGGTHSTILGHRNQEISNNVIETLKKYTHFDIKSVGFNEIRELSDLILNAGHLKPDFYKFYLTGCNGADAVEAALRLSFQSHWNNGQKEKQWVISRTQSYHGMSADALSLSDRTNLNSQKKTLSHFRRLIPQHNPLYGCYSGISELDYLKKTIDDFKNTISEIGKENIAAFVGETILGGLIGDVPPLKDYWLEISNICNENNIHLVLDEVYCGTASSGTYHCCEQDNVKPDFITLGKTLCAGFIPLSGLIMRSQIYEDAIKLDKRLQHSTTFQGHILGVASALAAQKILSKKEFIQDVFQKGESFRRKINNGLKNNPIFINIRGRGLRTSIEFSCENRNEFANELNKELFKMKIYNICKWHRLSITPPLNIEKDLLSSVGDKIIYCFSKISEKYKPAPISYEWLDNPNPQR